jgi:hypothetical protein
MRLSNNAPDGTTLSLRADLGDHDVDQECSSSSEHGEFHRLRGGTGCRCFGQDQHINIMGATMTRVLEEILLLSCMAAFVTGIVVAAASLLS